jgi:uncharacterized protein
MHFLMIYEMAPDYLERRGPLRNEHLKLAWEACDRGEMVLAGAFADPADGAAILFKGATAAVAEAFAAADPYVKNGLVKSWRVRKWTTVIGEMATTPLRPPT